MKVLIFCIACFISNLSFTQIVNIENMRLSNNKQGWSGRAEMNLNLTMNTRQLLQIGAELRLSYVKKRHQFLLLGDHSFVKSEGEDFINRGFQHFRYNYRIKDSSKFYVEAFQQSQFNRIQRINLRLLFGSGMRYDVIAQKNYQLTCGSGLMWEVEELIEAENSQNLLSTSYLSFDGQFNESIGINSISYFQPRITDPGNYRFSNETSIRFKINKYLSFRLIYSITHDSRDIPDIRKTNYVLRNALQIKF